MAKYRKTANKLARQGRYGDKELVHMSPLEIAMLSRIAPPTKNPRTGLPEFFNLAKMLTPSRGYDSISESALTKQLTPWQEGVSDMIDLGSPFQTELRGLAQRGAYDQSAQMNMLNRRNMAAGGAGGFSGAANYQNMAYHRNMGAQATNNWLSNALNQHSTGVGMQGQISENMAQRAINEVEMRNAKNQAGMNNLMQLGGGLMTGLLA